MRYLIGKNNEPPYAKPKEKPVSESAVWDANTKLLTDGLMNFMEQQKRGSVPDIVFHRTGRNLVVSSELVQKCSNGKDLLKKAVEIAQATGSKMWRISKENWLAIVANTKQIVYVLEDAVRRVSWPSQEFKSLDIASITYGNSPVIDIDYTVVDVNEDDGGDCGVDIV